MAIEVGKNRLEALGEVEETADLIRYYAKTASDNALLRPPDGQPRRRGRPHPVDPAAVRRVGGHQPRSTSRWRCPPGPRRRRCWPATRSCSSPRAGARDERRRARRGVSRRRRPRRRVQPRHGPRRHGGRGARRRTRASTASSSPARTRSASTSSGRSRSRYPRPCIVEMGGKNPAIVMKPRGPRGGGRGRHALGVRVRRPEVLRQLAGSTSSGPSTTSSSGCSSRRPSRSRSATRCHDELARPGHRPEGRRPPPAGGLGGATRRDGVHRRRAPDRWRPRPRASTSSRRSSACPAEHRLFRDELFVPFTAVVGGRLARRGAVARQRVAVRPDGRHLLARTRPRSARSSIASRPASCTSTAERVRRPAPGRASSRSAAGRARARRGRPGCRCTTSASSCASRATPIVD